jgi:hypothetical protein
MKKSDILTLERKKPQSNLGKTLLWAGSVVVLVFAAITFIFIPGMVRNSGSAPVFGYYDRQPISQTGEPYFVRMLGAYSEYARQSSPGVDQTYTIYQSAFNATAIHLAYSKAVNHSGYTLPPKKIDREMLPYFYDAKGVFSPKLFNDTPVTRRNAIQKEITENLIHQRYYDDMFGSSTETIGGFQLYGRKTPSKEEGFIKKMGQRERSFELAAFALQEYPLDQAAKFLANNPALFTRYNLSVVTLSSEDQAKRVKSQLTSNEVAFDDAIQEFSVKYYSGDDGKLTSSYQFQIKNILTTEADLASITSLESGAVSGVIHTVNGFSIFRCDGDAVAPDVSNTALQNEVKNYMTSYERGLVEDYFTNRARDFSVAAVRDGFESAGAVFGGSITDLQGFPLNYGNNPLFGQVPSSTVPELTGAEKNENFLKTAFSIGQNEISPPLVLGDYVVVIRLVKETDSADGESPDIQIDGGEYAFSLNQYYMSQFDQQASQNTVMQDKRFKNNFAAVFFKYYFASNL